MVRSFLRSFHFVFVYKLVPSLLHSFVRSPIVSFVFRSLLWSFVGSLVCFPDFFIRSFISFVLSFGPSVVRWFGRSLVCSIVRLFFRSLARSFLYSVALSFVHSFVCSFARSLPLSFVHSAFAHLIINCLLQIHMRG